MNFSIAASLDLRPAAQPPVRNLYRVLPDQFTTYQISPEDRQENGVRKMEPQQGGAPAVFRTGEFEDAKNFRRTPFSREYQFMAADLLAMRKYGKPYLQLTGAARDDIIRAFNSLYAKATAFTNYKGVNNCNNYITDSMTGEDPKIDPLICADSIVEVLETATNSRGIQMARLRSFRNPTAPSLDDTRVQRATIIYKSDGHISNFPQLGNGLAVPYPYISSQDCWYPLVDLERV